MRSTEKDEFFDILCFTRGHSLKARPLLPFQVAVESRDHWM